MRDAQSGVACERAPARKRRRCKRAGAERRGWPRRAFGNRLGKRSDRCVRLQPATRGTSDARDLPRHPRIDRSAGSAHVAIWRQHGLHRGAILGWHADRARQRHGRLRPGPGSDRGIHPSRPAAPRPPPDHATRIGTTSRAFPSSPRCSRRSWEWDLYAPRGLVGSLKETLSGQMQSLLLPDRHRRARCHHPLP